MRIKLDVDMDEISEITFQKILYKGDSE